MMVRSLLHLLRPNRLQKMKIRKSLSAQVEPLRSSSICPSNNKSDIQSMIGFDTHATVYRPTSEQLRLADKVFRGMRHPDHSDLFFQFFGDKTPGQSYELARFAMDVPNPRGRPKGTSMRKQDLEYYPEFERRVAAGEKKNAVAADIAARMPGQHNLDSTVQRLLKRYRDEERNK